MINNNTNITKETKRAFGMSELTGYPRKVSEAILPVVDVNPKFVNVCENVTSTTGALTTIYTTPANKDFYLTAASISLSKLVTSTCATAAIKISINGKSSFILNLSGFTLTAATKEQSISFNPPIKIDRSYAIGVQSNTSDTDINLSGSIYGYLLDNTGD